MAADGSVVIDVGMDISDAEKELASLKQKVIRLETELSENNYTKSTLEKRLKQLKEERAEVQSKTVIKDGVGVYTQENLQKILELGDQIANIEKQIDKINNDIDVGNVALDATKHRYAEITEEAERLRQIEAERAAEASRSGEEAEGAAEPGGGEAPGEEGEETISLAERVKAKLKAVYESVKNGFSSVRKAISTVTAPLKKVGSLIQSAFQKGLKSVKAFGKAVLSVAKHLNVFSSIARKLGPAMNKLGSMIKQAFVFGVVTKGLNYVREQMGNLISTNTEFMAALNRLKGVLMTAFQPIYEYIMPALTALINGLTRAMAVVAQFIAALFGKTASQAQASAKALNEESKSLEGTGKAADEAAGSLAGFDEINTIQTENDGGGGGGAGEGGADFGYEFDEEDMPFKTWGEAFDAFLQKILDSMPLLKQAFLKLAANINDFSKKLYDMFTFPGVKDKVIAIGQQLADAFNALVNAIQWYQLGEALGAGFNLALLLLVNFLYTFDWRVLGESLANGLNGIVNAIDWSSVGQLLWSGYKIAIETLAGFLYQLNMPLMAKSASDLVIGFFNSALSTIESIQWDTIGTKISTFLSTVNWPEIFKSITGFATGLMEGLIELIKNVQWVDIASKILDGLLEVDWTTLFGTLGDLIGATLTAVLDLVFGGDNLSKLWELGGEIIDGLKEGISNALSDVGSWIKEHIFQPFINGFKKVFGIHSPSTVMSEQGGLLMDGLKQGVSNKISSVVSTFTGLWSKIKEVFSHISEWFKEKFSAAWQAVKDVFSTGGEIFDGIKDGILDGLKAVINAIIGGINKAIATPFNGLNSALKRIKNVDILGLKPFSWINTISVPQIPKLAQGAVIPPNREFMAVLGDQKSGYNYEVPDAKLRQLIREETGSSVEVLKQILQAIKEGSVIKVDGTVFGRTAIRNINSVNRAAGKQLLDL